MNTLTLAPVVLCGGSGTRLWPLSREAYPKQFLSLVGEHSMLQQTLRRLEGLSPQAAHVQAPILVCNKAHRFLVASQLQEWLQAQGAGAAASIVLEPEGRNTAPALTLAALAATQGSEVGAQQTCDPILLAMPADHVMTDQAAFLRTVEAGLPLAADGAMLTFGVVARTPETGYGYIERSDHALGAGHHIASFTEKPDAATAGQYIASGRYYWNSGLFMVRASVWLKAIGLYRPDILQACQQAMAQARRDLDFIRPDEAAFAACPSDSIDYAVMERLPRDSTAGVPAGVLALDAGWSDLGAWDSLWDVLPHDAQGNATRGSALLESCSGTLLFSSGRLIAGVGLQDVVVVETPDAVLVADKSRAQEVKKIVGALRQGRQAGQGLADTHRKVYRPWGWYDSLDVGARFQVKRIVVNPGASLSLQMHHHRAEHWVVVSGTAEVTNGDKVTLLTENQSTYIPLGNVHRLRNPGKVPLEIIEVQSGSYLGEDDIVRFEDTYGRIGTQGAS
ncbi:mannose-1-phosphate guanylyltransferase/mannose-6-phosphate isomerase [Allofranklinella schreckenbergeri]|uniref:mannose-1-phosphate guanylyltransferase n=1 Tax=Allofranklinella schreckenbergeri TaxID=1076744 RepID=A0A3M6QE57_9BURK|nr:mannose-1-phosphate guanylyltransferase/mannose-6-phosphate isomerase [Allofranklinella schreckenbergeri]RMX01413.1 mannose-1-phosphate guanylyltransferase/mannose-6-phosphate isomerase [Allofranklinella schreckenbergeri]RMX01694.1 mannose-1-phosphate guanylyltransferase/mannose-6-phosphate isomerase [Allofranklinella schreckenbergeri]